MQAMARKINTQAFDMERTTLVYDMEKSALLCVRGRGGQRLWIKKLEDISFIANILEDNKRYYIACESGDVNGHFLAVTKETGLTEWFIPGKSFLQLLFEGSLYLIFVDENSLYYLLRVNRNSGKSSWHHRVDQDLHEYAFTKDEIRLRYFSGKREALSLKTGKPVQGI